MADLGRMTIEELASKVLADEHGDWLREAVAFVADALMKRPGFRRGSFIWRPGFGCCLS